MTYTNSISHLGITDIPQYRNCKRVFRDHRHAAVILSKLLESYRHTDTLILGIASSGIPFAVTLAETLGLDLDIAVAQKMTFPWDRNTAYGAVAFDGSTHLNKEMILNARLGQTTVIKDIHDSRKKVQQNLIKLQSQCDRFELNNRKIILVDDGITTGAIMQATIQALHKQSVKQIMLAIPTGRLCKLNELVNLTDKIYCANIRDDFLFTVDDAYQNKTNISTADAVNALTQYRLKRRTIQNTNQPHSTYLRNIS